jgi:hypothetical protein
MHGRGEISLLPLPGYDGLTYVAGGLRCQFLCNFYKRLASGSLFNLFSDCLLCPLMRPSCRFCFKLFVYSLLGGKTAGREPCRKGRSIMNGSRLKSCLRKKQLKQLTGPFALHAVPCVPHLQFFVRQKKKRKKKKHSLDIRNHELLTSQKHSVR